MKRRFLFLTALLLACGAFLWIAAINDAPPPRLEPPPYAEAGLTEREAAAHLLSRFTYGARHSPVSGRSANRESEPEPVAMGIFSPKPNVSNWSTQL